ncbi:MAG: tetratricopeptide repeat protein [Bacteroidota bacterium]
MKKENKKSIVTKKTQTTDLGNSKILELKTWQYNFIGFTIIIILGILIYLNSFNCTFHFDDLPSIKNNKVIQNLSASAIWKSSSNRFIPYYSLAINYHFGQLNVFGYHLVNLIIHLINSLLVWWMALLIFSTPYMKNNALAKHGKTIAFFTALLFVSHPLATQSVTYIVQRLASIAALFYFLTVALYLKARLINNKNNLALLIYITAFVSAIFAFISKENAYTLPFSVIMIEILFFQSIKFSSFLKDKRVWMGIALIVIFITIILTRFSFSIFNSQPMNNLTIFEKEITPFNYLFTQFGVILRYIQLLFLPINQNFDYDIPLSLTFFEVKTILYFLILLSLIVFGAYYYNKNRIITFGIFWFFIALLVESSIIPITDVIFEHRTYLPSFGFFILFSSTIFLIFKDKSKTAIIVLTFITVFYSFLTFERNNIWKDDNSLWSDVILKAPTKARAYVNRGVFFLNEKKKLEAMNDFNKAVELQHNYVTALYDRGHQYAESNNIDLAIKDYSKVLELDPNYLAACYNRGVQYANKKLNDLSMKDYNHAIEIDSTYADAYYNRGNLWMIAKNYEQAFKDFNKAIEFNPKYENAYYNKAIIFQKEAKYELAIAEFNKYDELKPNDEAAHFNRAMCYEILNKHKEAINDYDKAIELKHDYSLAYFNRGLIKFNAGIKDSACMDWKKALQYGYQPAGDVVNKYCH